MLRDPRTLINKPHFPYSATSSRGVASFLLFWRNNAHSQEKWIHFCSQVSIIIYIYTGILGTSDLALPSASSPGQNDKRDLTLYFFCVCVFLSTTSPYWNGPLIVIVQLQIWGAALQTRLAHARVAAKYEKFQLKRHFDSDWREMNMWQCVNQRGTVVCLCGLWR